MTKVMFVETRQIRRNHKTVQWCAGESYEFDPEMQPMIDIGHARIVEGDEESRAGPILEPASPVGGSEEQKIDPRSVVQSESPSKTIAAGTPAKMK